MKKSIGLMVLILGLAWSSFANVRSLNIGGVDLRLGMAQDSIMKRLTEKYSVTLMGESGYSIREYHAEQKKWELIGVISFSNKRLTFINKSVNTEGWPDDKEASVALAIYDAINSLIPFTDTDGAKRASASLVLALQDLKMQRRSTMRSMDFYVNGAKVSITISDDPSVKSVSVSQIIQSEK